MTAPGPVLPDPVRRWADERPGAPALVSDLGDWTWADLEARVSGTARALEDGPARVAVRAPTSPGLVVLVLAALRARRVLVPLSTRWTAADTARALEDLGIERLVVDDAHNLEAGALEAETVALEDVVANGKRGEAPPLDLGAPFTVVHTSGSTGRPKAILHSVGNHVWSARGVIDALGVGPGSRWLLDLPLYHVGGLGIVVRCALAGAAMAVPSGAVPAAERVARFRPTHASFVSTQLRRLLDANADLGGLQAVLLGGGAMPPALVEAALEAGVPAVVSYGLTEMTSTVTATRLPPSGADLATSGVPLRYRDVRISSNGEIEVGGPARYVARLVDGRAVPAPEWHRTGDVGRFDHAGRLVVTGRRDLQFVSGGENVHPEPIEAALLALEGVLEAAVVPVPDPEFGHRPAAFVRLEGADPARVPPATLRTCLEAVRGSLPGFMVPVVAYPWGGADGLKPDRPALTREAERRAAERP